MCHVIIPLAMADACFDGMRLDCAGRRACFALVTQTNTQDTARTMFDPLDPRQIARIESVHRGFLYQHLYAAGCLLLAGQHGVCSVTVEFDEDVELELDSGDRVYIQIKTRSSPL